MHGDIIDPDALPPDRLSSGIDARWIVTAENAGATSVTFGRATYAPGASVPRHRHPNAEEVVLVLRGQADHEIEGRHNLMTAGHVCFIPRMAPHAMTNPSPNEDLTIVWAYGGAASLEAAGFEQV